MAVTATGADRLVVLVSGGDPLSDVPGRVGGRVGRRGVGAAPRCPLGLHGREAVVVEFEDVVGGGDQSPFAADGGSAAALEAFDPAVLHGVPRPDRASRKAGATCRTPSACDIAFLHNRCAS